MAVKVRETIAVHLTPRLQEEFDRVCVESNMSVSDAAREALELYCALYKLDLVGVDFDAERAMKLMARRKKTFDEAVEQFEAVRRAIEIIIEAIKSKEE